MTSQGGSSFSPSFILQVYIDQKDNKCNQIPVLKEKMPFLNLFKRSHPSMQCLAHSRHSLTRSSSPEKFQFFLIFTSLQLERGKDFRAASLSTLITEVTDFKPKGLHPEFLTKLRMLPLMTVLTQWQKGTTEYSWPQSQNKQRGNLRTSPSHKRVLFKVLL